jgi:Cu-Zn family superoxide dismutase
VNKKLYIALAALAATQAGAQYHIEMNAIDAKGVGASIGTVDITAAPQGGLLITPNLKGLPPGEHGFHVHEFANCGAKEKDGKMSPGEMAGDHFDPKKTHKHEGPAGEGHMGDVSTLKVDAQGNATQPVTAPRLALRDLRRKALVIHEGGDNFSDQPKPNGGGGTRIACGVVGEK